MVNLNLTLLENLSNTTILPSSSLIIWPNILNSIICLSGLVTVSINISIFSNRTLTDKSYTLLLTEAIADLIYLTCSLVWPIFNYAIDSNSIIAALYSIAIDNYLTSCLAVYSVLIELFLSIDRLLILSNRLMLVNVSLRHAIICIALISLLFYLPVLFLQRIELTGDNEDGSILVTTSFGQTDFGKIIPTLLTVVRLFLILVCLFSINIVTLVKFKRYVSKKTKIVNRNQSSRYIETSTIVNLKSNTNILRKPQKYIF